MVLFVCTSGAKTVNRWFTTCEFSGFFTRNIQEDDIVQIGRVLSTQRNKHYGYDVMKKGIEVSKTHLSAKLIYIEAQTYAIPFYEKFDFVTISEPFLEDGIPHVKMIKSL